MNTDTVGVMAGSKVGLSSLCLVSISPQDSWTVPVDRLSGQPLVLMEQIVQRGEHFAPGLRGNLTYVSHLSHPYPRKTTQRAGMG